MTFTLSIEPTNGKAFIHGFHLGTIESVARQIAEEKFHARNANGMPTMTVALLRDGRLFDVYDGQWSSAEDFQADDSDAYPRQNAWKREGL